LKVFWNLKDFSINGPTVVTVGTFDGIHFGHQYLLERVRQQAAKYNATSVLVTFEPHPQLVVASHRPPIHLLTTIEEKINILESLELDCLVVHNFTKAFATLSADEFIKDILVGALKLRHIVVGHDHSFGRDRQGGFDLLNKYAQHYNYTVELVDAQQKEEDIASSTLVRKFLEAGQVFRASRLLNRNYSISGRVIHGDKRGRALGFPTANLQPYSSFKLVPKPGIYATRVSVGGESFDSVTYIGIRPTFGLDKRQVEVHIFDFDQEIYEHEMTVSFVDFIRDDAKFKRTDALIAAIRKDKKKAIEILGNGGNL